MIDLVHPYIWLPLRNREKIVIFCWHRLLQGLGGRLDTIIFGLSHRYASKKSWPDDPPQGCTSLFFVFFAILASIVFVCCNVARIVGKIVKTPKRKEQNLLRITNKMCGYVDVRAVKLWKCAGWIMSSLQFRVQWCQFPFVWSNWLFLNRPSLSFWYSIKNKSAWQMLCCCWISR